MGRAAAEQRHLHRTDHTGVAAWVHRVAAWVHRVAAWVHRVAALGAQGSAAGRWHRVRHGAQRAAQRGGGGGGARLSVRLEAEQLHVLSAAQPDARHLRRQLSRGRGLADPAARLRHAARHEQRRRERIRQRARLGLDGRERRRLPTALEQLSGARVDDVVVAEPATVCAHPATTCTHPATVCTQPPSPCAGGACNVAAAALARCRAEVARRRKAAAALERNNL